MKHGVNTHNKKVNFISIAVGLTALIIFFGMSLMAQKMESEAQAQVVHALDVKSKIQTLLSLIQDTETGQRGFIITGNKTYLRPYITAIKGIDVQLSALDDATLDNPTQQAYITKLHSLINQKLAELAHTISLSEQGLRQDAYNIVKSDEGQHFMNSIREIMTDMQAVQDSLLIKRQNKLKNTSNFRLLSTLLLFIIFFTLLYRISLNNRLAVEAQKSRVLLNNLLEATTNGILAVDESLTIQSANGMIKTIFGYSEEELIGQRLDILIPQSYHAQHSHNANEYISTGGNQKMALGRSVFGLKKNGTLVPLEIGLTKVPLEGEVLQIVATITDITEKQKASDALESIGRILEESLNEVYLFDAQTLSVIQVNHGARDNTGYSLAELQTLTAIDIKPNFTREEFAALIAPLFSGEKEKIVYETVHLRKDSSKYDVESHLQLGEYMQQKVLIATVLDISERKHAETVNSNLLTKLSQADELQRAILASSNHLIISTDSAGNVTQFNAAAESQLGYKAEAIVGKESPALWHDSSEVVKRAEQLSKELAYKVFPGFDVFTIKPREFGPETREWTFIRKEGSRFLVSLTVSCIRDEDSNIIGYLGVAEDITKRKQAENALRESKQFMQLIFDNSPALIFVKDENLKIIEANSHFLDLYPEEERSTVIGRDSSEGYDKNEVKEFQKYDHLAFENGYSAVTETIKFPNGMQRTFYTQKIRFNDTRDQRFILGIATDVTEYQAELFLLQQMTNIISDTSLDYATQIQLMLDEGCQYYQLPLGIISEIRDEDYKILSVCNTAPIEVGQSFDLGETYCAITYQKDEPFYSDNFGESEFNGHPCYSAFNLDTYIGCKIIVNGNAFGTVNFSDSKKRNKPFSRREVTMLKHIAQWISFMITQQQYGIEKDTLINKLSDSNNELEQFAYIASHDLKEPIRTLKTFTSYLIKDLEAGKQDRVDQDKSFIDEACERMTDLVDDILQLSRVGNTEYTLAPYDFNALVDDTLTSLKVRIDETNAKIHVEKSPISLNIDKSQLGLALQNLIQNALKFHKPNEIPDIDISISEDNDSIKLIVSDKGIGIPNDQVDKIFGIFKKLHNPSEYAGTGIGLAVVSKIMARHNGSVTVDSEENNGASFTLHLPSNQE